MKTGEERLTIVEHKVAENARGIDGLRDAVVKGFEAMDRRFEAIDRWFEAMDRRFEAMEQRFDRRFIWLTGTLVATMLMGLSILSAALFGG